MPTYQVTDPTTGQKLRLTGDSPPTEQELEQIFSQTTGQRQQLAGEMTHPTQQLEGTAAERNLPKVTDSGVLSGENQAKVAAITPVLLTATDPKEFSQIVRSQFPHIRQQQDEAGNEILFNPRNKVQTLIGGNKLAILQGLGIAAAYAPSGGLTGGATTTAGRIGLSALGAGGTETAIQTAQQLVGGQANPEQVAASTAFGAGAEAIGATAQAVRSAKQTRRALQRAAPTVEELRNTAQQVYQQIDNSGSLISGNSINRLRTQLLNQASRRGFTAGMGEEASARLYPKSSALRQIIGRMEGAQTITDLEQLRRAAQDAAQTLDRADANIARSFVNTIDDFMENIQPRDLLRGQNVSGQLRNARDLWGRVRKSELIQNALTVAEDQASGFENGIRVQLRSILKRIDTGKLKGFTQEEIDALRQVTRGTTPANFFKFLGKFGFSEKQATSMLGASIGVGGGAALGSAVGGPGGAGVGAVLVPTIGQVSKKLAQRLTRNNAQFADAVIRAGRNAREVTQVYLRNTPRSERSIDELGQLLLRTNLNAPQLANFAQGNRFIRDSLLYGALLQSKQADEIQPPQELQTEVRP